MIDIHNHIIPGVDDGAKSVDIALDMLREAQRQGVRHLVLTPHLYEPDILQGTQVWRERIEQGSQKLFQAMQKADLEMSLEVRAEVRYQELLHKIISDLDVLIGGRYLLLEFSFNFVPNRIEDIIYDLVIDGITPILAHPERIVPWQNEPSKVLDLIRLGCLSQIDLGSVLGSLGKSSEKLARYLLEEDAVHLAGSDSHNLTSRPLLAKPGYDWLCDNYGQGLADKLLIENPERIIRGEEIEIIIPRVHEMPVSWRDKVKQWLPFNGGFR
ncbi:MAG: hypothetical protein K9N11_01740 [Lentisphaeria bacterium]|nr:hypothetical protein [Candidatus Neomarinimicrobiota bacterium]MCF7841551.1 hypothetical protein [Lentisphaeria bacterium]